MEIKHKLTGEILINLCGADLREADLRGANLYGVDLREANLRGANLSGVDLRETDLRGTDLRETDLYGANLYGVDLRGANLSGVDLRGADLRGANLYGANLSGADLREAYLCGAKGILTFVGERDLLIYFKHKETYYFKIGCMEKTSDEWLRSFSDIGAQNRYSKDTTSLYGDIIKLFIQYDLNLS